MLEFNHEIMSNEYADKKEQLELYLNEILFILYKLNSKLEGNCFYVNDTFYRFNDLITKQLNLYWSGKQATKRIGEIGFNAGHSAVLMLLSQDKTNIDYTIFDIGIHPYVKPCLNYVKSKFTSVNFEYVEGDSVKTLPSWIESNANLIEQYDVFHVDGGLTLECITSDMKYADILTKPDGIIIIDDTNYVYINDCIDTYINSGNYREIQILKTSGYPHRIIQKINSNIPHVDDMPHLEVVPDNELVEAPKPVAVKPVEAPKPVAVKPVVALKPVAVKPVVAPKPAKKRLW